MHVLIVDETPARLDRLMIAFMRKGFQVTGSASAPVADICLRSNLVDLLVVAEAGGGAVSQDLALVAQRHNRAVATILLTADVAGDAEDMFRHMTSLHCVLAPDSAPDLVCRLGVASVAQTAGGAAWAARPRPVRVAGPVFTSVRAQPCAALA